MGRHAATSAGRRSAQLTPQVLIALAVAAVVLLAGGITWWAVGAGSGDCDGTAVVRVAVAPELAPVAEQVLTDAEGLRPADCASAQVTAQEPVQTVGDLGALDAGDLPHLWVPDSSLWPARAGDAALETAGSVATSPVVLATSRAAVTRWAGPPRRRAGVRRWSASRASPSRTWRPAPRPSPRWAPCGRRWAAARTPTTPWCRRCSPPSADRRSPRPTRWPPAARARPTRRWCRSASRRCGRPTPTRRTRSWSPSTRRRLTGAGLPAGPGRHRLRHRRRRGGRRRAGAHLGRRALRRHRGRFP
jgi:hypothetical protein